MMKRYEKYKPSGVEWIGEIPEHWKLMKIKYLIRDKITDGPHETPAFLPEGIPFLSVDGIQKGELQFNGCRFISKEDHEKYQKKCLVEKTDILMGKAASIGKIAQVKVDFEFSIWSPLALIKHRKGIVNPTYLEYFLKTPLSQYQIETLCTSNTQKNISMDDIPKIISILPQKIEQTAIANYLDDKTAQIDTLIANKQKLIELLKEERTAIINHAVTKGINPKAKLKASGIEWLGDIPEHWEVKRLKHLTEIISKGTTPSTIGAAISPKGPIRFIKAENILQSNCINSFPENFIDERTNESLKRSKLREGDILIVIAGATIGKVAILHKQFLPANTNQAVCFIRLADNYYSEWVWLFLQSEFIKETILLDAVQAAQPNLSMENIGNFSILLPNKREIGQIIESVKSHTTRIDATISKIEKEIELLQEYRTALISEVVTGKIKVI